MRNKAETVKIDMAADGITDPDISNHTYDLVMPMFSRDGHFDPAALKVAGSQGDGRASASSTKSPI